MKKIIAAVDALNFSEQELRSYKYLADKTRGKLTVLFLENIVGEYAVPANLETGLIDYDEIFRKNIKERQEKAHHNVQRLKNFYRDSGMDVTVRELAGMPATEVIAESRFADLLLVRNTTSFAMLPDSNPPAFVKDLLADARCPVMVIPEHVHYIREIIFSYNGSDSSTYALRQFSQLFEELSDVPVRVIYVVEKGQVQIPEGKLLKGYLRHHFENITFETLQGVPSAELLATVIHKKDSIMTFGAYGRSRASRFFHRSDADSILRTADIPLFITHP
ncbi:universal stress protein [Chitinophaga alhagiae]|uniref:universal stress protein n=1 Tax=Chitinophaga alhagiae TaxID=2203219 RepID=UPI000E5C0D64|nr:universal stress protein [Chitinophaga alhagiae]